MPSKPTPKTSKAPDRSALGNRPAKAPPASAENEPPAAGKENVTRESYPDTEESRRAIHIDLLGGLVYGREIAEAVSTFDGDGSVAKSAFSFVADIVKRMNPRDPLEEMLIVQALWAHARVGHLSKIANTQTGLNQLKTVNEYADRASNTYRRLMLALAEYRRPPCTPIGQTNIAGQQIVVNQNGSQETKNATNEQGCSAQPAAPAPLLLPDSGGPVFVDLPRQVREAVEAKHRPADAVGQGPIRDERPEAW